MVHEQDVLHALLASTAKLVLPHVPLVLQGPTQIMLAAVVANIVHLATGQVQVTIQPLGQHLVLPAHLERLVMHQAVKLVGLHSLLLE